jgi:S-adenosylmethionine-diacylglycerol 3-amino-3-carboxypropyl transferase
VSESIRDRAAFDLIRYANCWEDAEALLEGLGDCAEGRLLSIASGGDNSLALLTRSPELVVAVDLSPVQIALVDLKRQAIAALEYHELMGFLGFEDASPDVRSGTYRSLRDRLMSDSRAYWDRNLETIGSGVIHAGKFERYFALFRRRILPLVHSRSTTLKLLEDSTPEERRTFYDTRWDTWRWRLLFRLFFSRRVMGLLGRDPEFFRYVEGSVAERILGRVEHALTELPPAGNPYLHYILTGRFGPALPLYLRPVSYPIVRANLERLELHAGSTDDAIRRHGGRFTGMNLSDIFEYMDEPTFDAVAGKLVGATSPGGRLVYWNMLAPRSIASRISMHVRRLNALSDRLHENDRAFFYSALHVDEVIA